jgi:hypothetical protein
LPPLQDRAQLVAGLHGLQKISVFDEKNQRKIWNSFLSFLCSNSPQERKPYSFFTAEQKEAFSSTKTAAAADSHFFTTFMKYGIPTFSAAEAERRKLESWLGARPELLFPKTSVVPANNFFPPGGFVFLSDVVDRCEIWWVIAVKTEQTNFPGL